MFVPPAPTILVVFGATGDLMARKIVPSLFYLQGKGVLPERFRVVGFSRRDWSDADLRDRVRSILDERYPDAAAGTVERFLGTVSYSRGTFDDPAGYDALAAHLEAIDAEWGTCANKLFYLAVPPEHYEVIFRRLAASGLTRGCSDLTGWTRVLVEKPFGNDAGTSRELDELLGSLFAEEQIYRIDHYLAKEMLQGILNFRFTNNLFETAWDRTAIESIDIKLHETIGAEKRGRFYDGVGALRDVGQNHLLQMLALVTMEQPVSSGPAAIRQARAAALREQLAPMSEVEIARASYRSQYAGFRDIEGVRDDSETETYFKLRFTLRGPRWAGVPVTMESGKRIGEVGKRITVTLKHPRHCMCDSSKHFQNKIVFQLEPNDSIKIVFYAKKPGFDNELERREFNFFLYEKEEKAQYVEEYAKLLLDAIRGDQTLFVSTEEIRSMWEFIDPVVEAWTRDVVPLGSYEPETCEAPDAAAAALDERRSRGSAGVVGFGKMGRGIALNLAEHGWDVVGYNRTLERVTELADRGVRAAADLPALVAALPAPRVVWLMLTAGKPVDHVLFDEGALADLLDPGDIVIDGGNSLYLDAAARAERLAERGIRYLDCGTSGGPAGARNGACLMIGGQADDFAIVEPLFADIALHDGYRFFEGHGAGHFVKMVHNGIEYGMMQAIAEGFQIMREAPFGLDLARVAEVYQNGSVIESRLVGWLSSAFEEMGTGLEGASGMVGHTGEAEWTVQVADEMGFEARVIRGALEFRKESERNPSYAGQVLTALRNQFGGHGM
jgi:glucose-6-phosphate 1-dehydrogenase